MGLFCFMSESETLNLKQKLKSSKNLKLKRPERVYKCGNRYDDAHHENVIRNA